MTLSITTISKTTFGITEKWHSAKHYYYERCRNLAITLSVVMLSVTMVNVVAPFKLVNLVLKNLQLKTQLEQDLEPML